MIKITSIVRPPPLYDPFFSDIGASYIGLPRFTSAPENRGFDPKGAGAPFHPKNCNALAFLKGVISIFFYFK